MRRHAGTHTPTRTHHHPLFLCLCYLSLCHSYQQHPIRSEAYLPGRLSFCSNASSRRDSLLCLTQIRFLDALTKLSAKARTLQGLGWRRLRLQKSRSHQLLPGTEPRSLARLRLPPLASLVRNAKICVDLPCQARAWFCRRWGENNRRASYQVPPPLNVDSGIGADIIDKA